MTRIVFSLAIDRSKIILTYLIAIHSIMLLTLLSLLELSVVALLTTIILLASFIYYCRQHQWLGSDAAVVGLERDAKQHWYLESKNGKRTSALQLRSCFVTPSLLILNFKGDSIWPYKTVTLFVDALETEKFRKLRVYCRHPKTFCTK
jgi:hypothetical protein